MIYRDVTGCADCPFAAEADAGMYCTLTDQGVAADGDPYTARADIPADCPLRRGPLMVRMTVSRTKEAAE